MKKECGFHCVDICPLPNGNADKIEDYTSGSSFRIKTIGGDKNPVGQTLVRIEGSKSTGIFSRVESIPDPALHELITNGIPVKNSTKACPDMIRYYKSAKNRATGGTIGSLECKYTNLVAIGSGSSFGKVNNSGKAKS